jgi:hypothetical protein
MAWVRNEADDEEDKILTDHEALLALPPISVGRFHEGVQLLSRKEYYGDDSEQRGLRFSRYQRVSSLSHSRLFGTLSGQASSDWSLAGAAGELSDRRQAGTPCRYCSHSHNAGIQDSTTFYVESCRFHALY